MLVVRFWEKMDLRAKNTSGQKIQTVHFQAKIFCRFHFAMGMNKITQNGQIWRGSLAEFGSFLQTMALKAIETLENFKAAIKRWKPENCPCTLCRDYIHGVGYVTPFE